MESNGSGLTFTENDLIMAKRIIGLLNSTKFNLDPLQMVQGAEALVWLQRDLVKGISDNIMEFKRNINPTPVKGKK